MSRLTKKKKNSDDIEMVGIRSTLHGSMFLLCVGSCLGVGTCR